MIKEIVSEITEGTEELKDKTQNALTTIIVSAFSLLAFFIFSCLYKLNSNGIDLVLAISTLMLFMGFAVPEDYNAKLKEAVLFLAVLSMFYMTMYYFICPYLIIELPNIPIIGEVFKLILTKNSIK